MNYITEVVEHLIAEGYGREALLREISEQYDVIDGRGIPKNEAQRFNGQECYTDDQLDDIKTNMAEGGLIGIVDETKGGFIGYAIGEEHAKLFIDVLTIKEGKNWEINSK